MLEQLGPVLIANRGEIAVRVARTVRANGLRAVGIFTDTDAGALHVDALDAAVSVDSYLSADEVLRAARALEAQSIHPGYGFLSESPVFAQAVLDAGLTWIGPPPDAIELMGDKGRAKEAATAAGVPVVPSGDDSSYPVVVKAVAGGGGKGMRVVWAAHELEEATAAAQREARVAFGDDRVIIERWIERPRHLEVQVLADRLGTVVHLGERECSLQRRHQKVVEEAPSPVVCPELREQLGAAAVALARACDYEGAGTVEFITTGADEFFFLEMNTRLQVEHPVTELVWGIDLVEQQLRIAAGLELQRPRAEPVGWAVEARLYAEDPGAGFLPSTGTVRRYREPVGARVDSGIREGYEVSMLYDPMLAKVVVHAADRRAALRELDRALSDLELLGVATNAAFTRKLLALEDVRAGKLDTGLLERVLAELPLTTPEDLLPAAALAACGTATPAGLWRRAFEVGEVRIAGGEIAVTLRGGDTSTTHRASVRSLGDGAVRVTLDGVSRRYAVALDGEDVWIGRDGHQLAARARRFERRASGAPAGSLEAPMPGTVLRVRVSDGDEVAEGEVLLVLESMKMELSITAPWAGKIDGLTLRVGDRVALKQPLVTVIAP